MLLSALAFSLMSVFVKAAGGRLPSQEIVFARAVVSTLLSVWMLRRAGVDPWGNDRRGLVTRGLLGFVGLTFVYYSLTHLPIAAATVIQYLHPMFTALLAALVLRERVGAKLAWVTALSFGGLVAVAQPWAHVTERLDPLAVAVAVGGAFFSAAAYVAVRKISATEHPLVIVFYFPLISLPLALLFAGDWVWPVGLEWLWLAGVGVFTQLGQVYLTLGLTRESAGRATALSYTQVVFAAVWGVVFFGEIPDGWTLAGAALIMVGALVNLAGRRHAA
jgi:drug/metabolite transporter (DMT)-like permease